MIKVRIPDLEPKTLEAISLALYKGIEESHEIMAKFFEDHPLKEGDFCYIAEIYSPKVKISIEKFD